MKISELKVVNFRNYDKVEINFSNQVNILVGQNAQGKTNLLEAIYTCLVGKSFRTSKDRELIKLEKNLASTSLLLIKDDIDRQIDVSLSNFEKKYININGKYVKNRRELTEKGIPIVLFTPETLKLIKEGPQERRKLLDELIFQIKPAYIHYYSQYYKVLQQRNQLLKKSYSISNLEKTIYSFDCQLIEYGLKIEENRQIYCNQLSEIASKYLQKLTDGKEKLKINYLTNFSKNKNEYEEKMQKNLIRDFETRTTAIGPHRDDLLFLINDRDVKIYGSQGQQRTVVLSLKLAEMELIKKETNRSALLLLDDVLSELDRERKQFFLKNLYGVQSLITTTNFEEIKNLEGLDKKVFLIKNGTIEKVD